jgi:hypothetical protein
MKKCLIGWIRWIGLVGFIGWIGWISPFTVQPTAYGPKSIAHTDLPVMVLLFLKPGPMIVTVNGKANVRGKRSP